ncbi:NUDIX hydrolase [Streptomyces sp. CAU 1734]|uniref:NUDIX hydrolase n=1 Tax=Streptomyces sp. CAU 1734 TaxID=3140360 RepID=UPI0032602C77
MSTAIAADAGGPGLAESVPVVVAVISRDRRTLVIRPRTDAGGPRWRFPGGKAEPGESPEETAVRETREETGLTVAASARLGARVHPDTGRHIVYIACTPVSGIAHVASRREIAEVAWIVRTPAALDAYLPDLYEPVRQHLAGAA